VKYPEFGEKTDNLNVFDQNDCPWIFALSRGGLTAPSQNFVSTIKKFEKTFQEIHGSSISKRKCIIADAARKICEENQSFPSEVIKTFVKTRTFIRIKFLNHQLKVQADSNKARNSKKLSIFRRDLNHKIIFQISSIF
jgi:hypothetical protein